MAINIEKQERFFVTCDECKSELSYLYNDPWRDRALLQMYITCPVCKHDIWVDDPEGIYRGPSGPGKNRLI